MKETDPTLTLPLVLVHSFGPAPIPFVFLVPPQRVQPTFDPPVSVQRTAGKPYLNDFSGQDQMGASFTIEGTFGYMPRVLGAVTVPGSVALKVLETTIETYNALSRQQKRDIGARQELIWPARLWYWRIAIKKFSYRMSKESPLLFFYSLVVERVEDYLSPAKAANFIGGAVTSLGDSLAGIVGGSESAGAGFTGADGFTGVA